MSSKTIIDPNLPFVEISKGKGFSEEHNKAIALLSALLYRAGYSVNYDHIASTTPRSLEIPLTRILQNGRIKRTYDIAFYLDNKTLVFIEIKTHRLNTEVD